MERPVFGVLAYDMSHLLAGAVLMLSFALLTQRRLAHVVSAYALQAVLLAVEAAWQGWAQAAPQLYLTALVTLGAKGVAIPLVLRAVARRLGIARATEPALGVFASMAMGVALVALSLSVVLPTTAESQAVTREDLGIALAVILLGLLTMITRRTAFGQVMGFLSMENGLILAAVGVRGMPLVVELSVAVLVLLAAAVSSLFFFRIRAMFASLETRHIDRLGGAER